MAGIKNGRCTCYDCEQQRKKEEEHLNHPFYKRVDEVTDEVKVEQIIKGAHKYKEPFNPDSWTNIELVKHQLQELRDAQVYSVGLLDRLEKQEKAMVELAHASADKVRELEKEIEGLKATLEYWRAVANLGK